jgi:hypothetical protein
VRRVHSVTIARVSVQPPSHPGRSDFPSPVGGSSYFPKEPSHGDPRLKHSPAYIPGRDGYILGSASREVARDSGSRSGRVAFPMPATHREPLCPEDGVTLSRNSVPALFQPALPDLHRSYRLMRQAKILPPASVSLFRQVFAGCYEPLLEDGPSRRHLHGPCTGAWVRTPPRPNGVLVRFFPLGIGLPLGSRGSARERSRNAAFRGGVFRGCNHSVMFRLPCLFGPLAAQTVRARCPSGLRGLCSGLRGLCTGQYPRRRRSRAPASLRVRIRTIDTAGLVRAIALTHLLDRSLVGCS